MGVPIRLHFTFLLLLICLAVFGLSSNQSPGNYTLFVLAVIGSVLLHELGHALVSLLYGIRTIEIVMYPIGGVARLERPPKPWEEFWIALAGPAINLAIAGSIFAVLYSQNRAVNLFALVQPSDTNLADRIALANLVLGAFNLLPAFPMDGGRMLRAILSRLSSEYQATRIATWSGRMLAISMGLYGFINMPMLAFVAFFIYLGAANEGAASRGRSGDRPPPKCLASDRPALRPGSPAPALPASYRQPRPQNAPWSVPALCAPVLHCFAPPAPARWPTAHPGYCLSAAG